LGSAARRQDSSAGGNKNARDFSKQTSGFGIHAVVHLFRLLRISGDAKLNARHGILRRVLPS
jgi:hypothetical protein